MHDLFKLNHKTFLHMHTSKGYMEPLVFLIESTCTWCSYKITKTTFRYLFFFSVDGHEIPFQWGTTLHKKKD